MDLLSNWWLRELLIPLAKATCWFEPSQVLHFFSSLDDKYIMTTKTCNRCKLELPLSSFSYRRTTTEKLYPASRCRQCLYQARKEIRTNRGESPSGYQYRDSVRRCAQDKIRRLAGEHREVYLLADCRSSDKKRGFVCDLDREFVIEQINLGCSYCGSHKHMTLDRIDNSVGHVKTNVVPACYRCNMIRRDMPHEAWLMIVPAIRATAESGLFGDWYSVPMARKRKPGKTI
jgi:hypothetical protein